MRSDDGGSAINAAIALRSVAGTAEQIRALTVADFDAWVQAAQPGARRIYGMGIDAHSASGRDVPKRLMALYEAGLVILHQKRARIDAGYPIDFIVVRRAKPVPKGFPELPSMIAPMMNKVGKVGGK